MLNNCKNINIDGSPTFNLIQNVRADRIDEGLIILYDHAAPGALHDSGEHFDPPNCHPDTRVAVREAIMTWIDNPNNDPVMWMNGAMGGGKSSITQAIAELYHRRGQLAGSFFFARASSLRNDEKRLVATLAYQMSTQMPQIRPYISAHILHDPLIFESSLKSQIEALILGPQSQAFKSAPSNLKPQLIIIDGLDECINTKAQALIVKELVSSFTAHRHKNTVSFKILIVSRPERNIEGAFRDPGLSPFVIHLSLNEIWLPDNDIRRFLVDKFADIRRSHPTLQTLLATDWPPTSDIEELVQRSSGQFIYASVVIKFLESPRNHPIHSLEVIFGLSKDSKRRPYAELDALYEHIFSQVEDLPLVLRILCLRLAPSIDIQHSLTPDHIQDSNRSMEPHSTCGPIEDILDLPKGMLCVALTDLVSILRLDQADTDEYIEFYHASLSEFLMDQDRSGRLYVNSEEIHVNIASHCIPIMKNAEIMWSRYWRLNTFKTSYTYLSAEARSSLSDTVSDLDIMPAMEGMDMYYCVDVPDRTLPATYLDWFFAEHMKNLTTNCPHSLGNAVKNISKYIMRQYKAFPFSGFDRANGLDLWMFAMIHTYKNNENLTEIANALSILTDSDCSEILDIGLSPSVDLCWRTLHALPFNVLSDVDLFGEYSMTGARYISGALCLFKAIPKMSSCSRKDPLRKYLKGEGWHGIARLLDQTPASKALFEILKKAMVKATWEVFSGDDPQELAYLYVARIYGTKGSKYSSPQTEELAAIYSKYMEKTRGTFPTLSLKSGRLNRLGKRFKVSILSFKKRCIRRSL